MHYRSSDAKLSTRDWFSLNTDSIPQSLLVGPNNERFEDLTEIPPEPPELDEGALAIAPARADDDRCEAFGVAVYGEPDPDDYTDSPRGREAFEADLAIVKAHNEAAREYAEERENEEALPMWGTLFRVDDSDELRAACREVGLRLYEHEDVAGLLIGADSAGHSFYGAYWIPLRAKLALGNTYSDGTPVCTGAERRALIKLLRDEASRESESAYLERIIAETAPKKTRGRKAA